MAGLMNPMTGWPLATACWLAMALNAAHNGAPQLVPPVISAWPLSATMNTLSAMAATSGELRKDGEPPLVDILIGDCQEGMEYELPLMPPPVPEVGKTFHTFS